MARHELSRLQQALTNSTATITPEIVRQTLADFTTLLADAAGSKLGPEAVYKDVTVFRALVGGRIWVQVETRASRKRTNARGVFRSSLLASVCETTQQTRSYSFRQGVSPRVS